MNELSSQKWTAVDTATSTLDPGLLSSRQARGVLVVLVLAASICYWLLMTVWPINDVALYLTVLSISTAAGLFALDQSLFQWRNARNWIIVTLCGLMITIGPAILVRATSEWTGDWFARFSAFALGLTLAIFLNATARMLRELWPASVRRANRAQATIVLLMQFGVLTGGIFFATHWFLGTTLATGLDALPKSIAGAMCLSVATLLVVQFAGQAVERSGHNLIWGIALGLALAGGLMLTSMRTALPGAETEALMFVVLIMIVLSVVIDGGLTAPIGLVGAIFLVPAVLFYYPMPIGMAAGAPADLLLAGATAFVTLILIREQDVSTLRRGQSEGRHIAKLWHLFTHRGAGKLYSVDLQHKTISPIAAYDSRSRPISFARFFARSQPAQLLRLIDIMEGRKGASNQPRLVMTLPLMADQLPGLDDHNVEAQSSSRLFEIHVLAQGPGSAVIGALDVTEELEHETRAQHFEKLLGEALVREERLLSVAAHELRTPAAILSMLAEELDSGIGWREVSGNFRKSLGRVVAVIDDLRLHSSGGELRTQQMVFTLNEVANHLRETLGGAAAANGVSLIFSLSQTSSTLLSGDYGRVYIALLKLLHNAIIHSGGTEVTLSVLLSLNSGNDLTVIWQISDNGQGIPAAEVDTIFRPFDSSGTGAGDDHVGLGLYTARKAARTLGGDVYLKGHKVDQDNLRSDINGPATGPYDGITKTGCTFVFTHPARLEKSSRYTKMEHKNMSEQDITYESKTVLLVEDNRVVGEITTARLRRIFGTTLWAESGDEGLIAYQKNKPDLILMDQLLPGLLGSELIKLIRQTDTDTPIVGITASTMGSECAELEAAGANYALEKPLSIVQLRKIASEFFET